MSTRIYNGYVRRYEDWCHAYEFEPDCEIILKQYEKTLKFDRMLEPNYVKRIIGFLKNHFFPKTIEVIKREAEAKSAIAQSRRYKFKATARHLNYRKRVMNDIINQRKRALPRDPRRFKQLFTREEFEKIFSYAQNNYRKNKLALLLRLSVVRNDLKPKKIYDQMNVKNHTLRKKVIEPFIDSSDGNLIDLVRFASKELFKDYKMFPLSYHSYQKQFKQKCQIILDKSDVTMEMFQKTLLHFKDEQSSSPT